MTSTEFPVIYANPSDTVNVTELPSTGTKVTEEVAVKYLSPAGPVPPVSPVGPTMLNASGHDILLKAQRFYKSLGFFIKVLNVLRLWSIKHSCA
jgi:hypothetical protein